MGYLTHNTELTGVAHVRLNELLEGISEIVRLIRQHGNAQAKRTVDAGGSANTTTVSRARAVYVGGLPAKQMTEQKPSLAVSLMPSNPELSGAKRPS